MVISKKEKIKALEHCIHYVETHTPRSDHGLCIILYEYFGSPYDTSVEDIFPEFIENRPEGTSTHRLWWPWPFKQQRIDYCKKIINILKDGND